MLSAKTNISPSLTTGTAFGPSAAVPHRLGVSTTRLRLLALPDLASLWHLFSLDAPTVAAVWVFFIARAVGLALPWKEPAAMFAAVWILYAADRLLDARVIHPERQQGGNHNWDRDKLEARHRFHERHRTGFSVGIAMASLLLLWLLRGSNSSVLRLDCVLGGLLLVWLLLVHLRPASSRGARLPKELAVGLFFPAAIFIPTVARFPNLRPALAPEALLFAGVCTLNCLFIYAWEHPHARQHAHGTTRWAAKRLPLLTLFAVFASLGTAVVTGIEAASHSPRVSALPALACAGSATLLLLLHRRRHGMSPLLLRATADLCLLTPALLLPAFRLLAR